jgi:hypothetical protein
MMNDATPNPQDEQSLSSHSDPVLHPRRSGAAPARRPAASCRRGAGFGASRWLRRWAHAQRRTDVETPQQQQAIVPEVRTSLVTAVTEPRQVDLPGSTWPLKAPPSSRATGYIASVSSISAAR